MRLFLFLLIIFPFVNSQNGGTRPLRRYVEPVNSNSGSGRPSAYSHPLDPLTEDEINLTSAIIRKFSRIEHPVFNYITLKEPEKALLLPFFLQDKDPTRAIPRRTFSVVIDRENNRAYEAIVNLDRKQIEKWSDVQDGNQPTITPDEGSDAQRIAREDKEVIRRARRLGWTDMSLVNGDIWSSGYIGDRQEYRGRRLAQVYMYGKNHENDFQYTHPFDFVVMVDLNEHRVVGIEDLPTHDDFDATNKRGTKVPRAESHYDPDQRDPATFRQDLNPLNISQPNGASYRIRGNEVSWQKYKFRVGFNGREGLVLYNLNYKDGQEVRPLFYRMSLGEMFIPYGDPRPPYHRKHVFDEGNFGIGYCSNELQAQVDCLGEVFLFDAYLNNEAGEGKLYPKRVCVVEEDDGILWKHTDYRTGKSDLVRNQRLTLTFMATVENYDYIFSWHLAQDGTIEFNVRLTGILSTNLLAVDATPAGHGTEVFPQINAQYHQHFFGLRLDAEIDGNKNTVVMQDVVPLRAPLGSRENPYGQGFTTKRTVFKTAEQARTNNNPQSSRSWLLTNDRRLNPYSNLPVSYKLIPWAGAPPLMMRKGSPIHETMAQWLDYNTWVTRYNEDEILPGGYYLNNSGLPEWIRRDPKKDVEDEDIVVWHNLGISHIPKPEDFPVMPMESCGILLRPTNFFVENPALDVLPPGGLKHDEL